MAYWPLHNCFRRAVCGGVSLIGGWASLATPIGVGLHGIACFDWLPLDAEHAPNDATRRVCRWRNTLDEDRRLVARRYSGPVVEGPGRAHQAQVLDEGRCSASNTSQTP